ncbi:MAG TPA: molybdopterin dinucleotide binding domain-containing protein, partial [Solirubrobacterales bacterium]|nr:molybdopterin dinucleotide binding domain-containing protein [Solirubrobacterales bacterium]
TPTLAERMSGVPAGEIERIALELATAEGGVAYGRVGVSTHEFGSVCQWAVNLLNIVTGNLDREGGAMFGDPPIDFGRVVEMVGLGTYGKVRSRVGDLPEVLGSLPASVMAKEITTPGKGQIRAMFFSAGNPVLSVPNGDELEAAMAELELSVAIDLYVTDTSRHCDFVLPATTMYEREDFPLPFLALFTTPFVQMTEPVVEPRGEARQEWEVIEAIAGRIGVVPSSSWPLRQLGRLGIKLSPRRLLDVLLRTGPKGDRFGLRRGGLSIAELERNPHGMVLAEHLAPDVLGGQIRNETKLVRLDPPEIAEEARRLVSQNGDHPDFPLRLIGLRELRSHNSWMHNSELLMRGGRSHAARVHPDDAEACGIEDSASCRISSAHGSIELPARVTDEVKRGTIAVPHGWGHRGGWRLAAAAGGANVNLLSSSDPEDLERLAGMAFLNGIPVRLEPVGARRVDEPATAVEAPA